MKRFTTIIVALTLALLVGGCLSNQSPTTQPTQPINPQQTLQKARDTVAMWQGEVSRLQASMDALHAQLNTLPPDLDPKHPNPTRKAIEKALATVEPSLASAQLWLNLAHFALDAFAGPPTTQPVK